MSGKAIDLYELLPVVYRLRDAEQGYPLKALLDIISAQADVIKRDIDGLWDDFFIETCADWVVPYIGDLVGQQSIVRNHPGAPRRRGQNHLLPAAQGRAAHAGRAGPRYYRLGRPCRGRL